MSVYLHSDNWSFFQPSLYVYDSSAQKNNFSNNYNNGSSFLVINPMLGLSYTQVLTNNMSLGIYYQYGAFIASSAHIGTIQTNIRASANSAPTSYDLYFKNNNGPQLCQAIGLLYRLRHLVIGFEYKIISNEKIRIEGNNLGPGNVYGTYSANPFTITLGVAITGKRKE